MFKGHTSNFVILGRLVGLISSHPPIHHVHPFVTLNKRLQFVRVHFYIQSFFFLFFCRSVEVCRVRSFVECAAVNKLHALINDCNPGIPNSRIPAVFANLEVKYSFWSFTTNLKSRDWRRLNPSESRNYKKFLKIAVFRVLNDNRGRNNNSSQMIEIFHASKFNSLLCTVSCILTVTVTPCSSVIPNSVLCIK